MIDANKEFEIDACFRGWMPPEEAQKLKDEIERLRNHPVFASTSHIYADPENNKLTIDYREDGAARAAFDALLPEENPKPNPHQKGAGMGFYSR